MRIAPASASKKAKVYLDDRDLDQSDSGGHQEVKSVVITDSSVVILIEAHFDPEMIGNIAYPAGSVFTQMTINRSTGILKKVETIKGGILGANLGEGTKSYEEKCVPAKNH